MAIELVGKMSKMDWHILPRDPTADCLEVHLTLDRPYYPIQDALEASFSTDPTYKLVSTQGSSGSHRFEVLFEDSFQTLVKLFDDLTPRTEVVIENRRPSDAFYGCAWKSMVIEVTRRLCEQLSNRGYIPEADRAKLVTALAPYRPV